MNIKEVAKRANVSISTVSRVINNTAKVSVEARERVEKVIKDTSYRPNSLARELQQKRTNTIGIIMSAYDFDSTSIGQSINAITDILKSEGYNIMLGNSRFHEDEEFEFLRVFQEKRVDGILYFASRFSQKHYDVLENYPIPIVMIGQKYKEIDIPYVVHDDYNGAKLATEYVINKGHRKIGYIGCPLSDVAAGLMRYNGYESALYEHGIAKNLNYEIEGDFTLESGYKAASQLFSKAVEKPTAIVAMTDFMAMGTMRYLNEQGINVPEDVSVIGFDDVNVSAFYNPPLTTIRTDKEGAGLKASELLLKILKKESDFNRHITVGYELIERNSVKSISKDKWIEVYANIC